MKYYITEYLFQLKSYISWLKMKIKYTDILSFELPYNAPNYPVINHPVTNGAPTFFVVVCNLTNINMQIVFLSDLCGTDGLLCYVMSNVLVI